MRKVLTVLLYLAIIGAGAWLIGGWIEEGGRKITALAGGFLALFGLYMLWTDFFSRERP
jgi:predicted MFS family arabinose efflux permease